ncbi:MAG: hypothetical protein ACI38U_03230 [Corynebacterium sp.]|uniref:hypothetical protein n=1 Tax=Corynebacterium sp. TaxID=1720 RepID=UPI003F00435D
MTDIGIVPVLVREDGHIHILSRRRVLRRHLGRAHRRGLTVTLGAAHIAAVPDTSQGHHTMRCAVTHITDHVGDTLADFRETA